MLTIRPLVAADAPLVLDAFRSHADFARQATVETLTDAERYVARAGTGANRAFVVSVPERIRSFVGLDIDDEHRLGWMYYWTHARDRGLGLASAAVTTIANHALRPASEGGVPGGLGLERLELGYRVTNAASAHVAEAAGFVPEGLQRGKFLIEGERVDVQGCGRVRGDAWPHDPHAQLVRP